MSLTAHERETTITRIYIAGPIAGIAKGNAKAFARAADRFRSEGWDAINPHEIPPHEHSGPCPPGRPAGQTPDGSESPHAAACYMRTDMQALLTCDAIYLLAGWELSEGATAEFLAARAAGLAIFFELHGAGVAS